MSSSSETTYLAILAGMAVMALLSVACGTGSLTRDVSENDEIVLLVPADESAIYGAAAFYLATDANSFGPGHRFSELVVVERLHAGAGNVYGLPGGGGLMSSAVRSAIRDSLLELGPVRFVPHRPAYLESRVANSAVLVFAPIVVDGRRVARVGASLECERHCRVWTTIDVVFFDGDWAAISDGPRTIS